MTDHERGELAALVAEGLSAAQIGQRLGISRNAAMGRCNRAGLQTKGGKGGGSRPTCVLRDAPAALLSMTNVEKAAAEKSKNLRHPEEARRAVSKDAAKPAKPAPVALSLVDLDPGRHCRWPINDGAPEYLFCAGPREPGSTYCPTHRKLSGAAPRSEAERQAAAKRFTAKTSAFAGFGYAKGAA